jgi:hypothetical protein
LARSARAQRGQAEENVAAPKEKSSEPLRKEDQRPLSKLALLAAQNKSSPPKLTGANSPSSGLSKLAQKINTSRAATKQTANELATPVQENTLPQWELYQRAGAVKLSQPSIFGKILTNISSVPAKPVLNDRSPKIHQYLNEAFADNSTPFAFNSPSPDDIVMHARRGTTLGHSLNTRK